MTYYLGGQELPIVIGKIQESYMGENDSALMPYIDVLHAQQEKFAQENDHVMLDTVTNAVEFLEDGWHYKSGYYVKMGESFAKNIKALQD